MYIYYPSQHNLEINAYSTFRYQQVGFVADVSKSYTTDSYEIQEEGGMYLRDVYIQGASWDTENNCLSHSRYVYNASERKPDNM